MGKPKRRRQPTHDGKPTTAGERLARRLARATAKAKAKTANRGGIAERAWRRWTDLPGPKRHWVTPVEQFVSDQRPGNPEHVAAVLLLALDNAHGWPDLWRAGAWVGLAGVHVYTHFTGAGYGDGRVYHLLERFVWWLHRHGRYDGWDLRHTLRRIDEARAAHGVVTRGHPAVHDPSYTDAELDELAARFADDRGLDSDERTWMRGTLASVVRAIDADASSVRLGRLCPFELEEQLLMDGEETDCAAVWDEVAGSVVLMAAADFYDWLGTTGRLEASRADELAAGLREGAVAITEPLSEI